MLLDNIVRGIIKVEILVWVEDALGGTKKQSSIAFRIDDTKTTGTINAWSNSTNETVGNIVKQLWYHTTSTNMGSFI